MLYSSIENVTHNAICSERMKAALGFLARTDLADIECGRHDIMGDEVFANVMEFDTCPAQDKDFEAHRRYTDIHFVIRGTERLCVAPIDEVEPVGAFNDDDDFGLYCSPKREAWVELHEGDLVVTPPEDAHKPGCCGEEGPAKLKKVCVKVLVD